MGKFSSVDHPNRVLFLGGARCVYVWAGVEDLGRENWRRKKSHIPWGKRGGGRGLMCRAGQNLYIRCIYGIFGREITRYTVLYVVYIRFWPTLLM